MSELIAGNILQEQKTLAGSRQLTSEQSHHYRIWQDSTSPYSHKVMTYMHYKGIPYKRMQVTLDTYTKEIPSLVGQTIIPVILTPDDRVMQDSTPIMQWFETQYPANAAIPQDRRLAFIMWLLEEFGDEYMPRIHMHTRWGNEQNRQTISHRIARGLSFASAELTAQALAPMLLERQSGFDLHLGLQGDGIRDNMERQIADLLAILEEHFTHFQFLLGFKPSLADFSLYGSLHTHLFNDPQSNQIMEVGAPRTCRWMDTINDFGDSRGCVGQTEFGDWLNLDDYPDSALPASLAALLAFVGKTYIPFAKACAVAGGQKEKTFSADIYGLSACFSTHQYRVWSFEQLQLHYQQLQGQDKTDIDKVLTKANILSELTRGDIVHNGLFDGFTPPFVKDGVADARLKHIRDRQHTAVDNT